MKDNELVTLFKEMPWEVWLHRRFSVFVTYVMMTYATPAGFKSEGINGQFPISLYDTDDWYSTPEMFTSAGLEAAQILKEKNIFTITKQCESVLQNGREEIPKLIPSTENPTELFKKVLAIIGPANVYIWLAHACENYYYPRIREALRPYVPEEELQTFIGDISFPSKKNAFALLEEDVRRGIPLSDLHSKYAWMKARGGFRPGYSLEEMKEVQEKILNEVSSPRPIPAVPEEVQSLAREVQELVYLRTLRTDTLYELYYLAQPIFERYASSIGIESVKDYLPHELLSGKFEIVPREHAVLKYQDQVVVVRESIMLESIDYGSQIQGVVAFKGKVTGRVRVVHAPADAEAVEEGDIIVTNMTTPAFIAAMHRASAFVTNEGGITCHAAILARELKKPCITGTKNATKILKDGDMIEVDAERGIVTILERGLIEPEGSQS